MTEDAAGLYKWACRANTTAASAWEEMQELNEEVDWNPAQMLADMEGEHTEGARRETEQ